MKNPSFFRGQRQHRRYFEGWYFKCISADRKHALAFIPGIAVTESGQKHAFLQVIDAVAGRTYYFDYPYPEFAAAKDKLAIKVGENSFDDHQMTLNLSRPNPSTKPKKAVSNEPCPYGKLAGTLHFSDIHFYPSTPLHPGIMGPFSFIPRMECYHAVVHLYHKIHGSIQLDGQIFDFEDGTGYIEKDYGRSFPETYVWLQASHFQNTPSSFVFSRARIPFLGREFTGFFAYFSDFESQAIRFATYNRSRLINWHVDVEAKSCRGSLVSPAGKLDFSAVMQGGGKLRAPVNGGMQRTIIESITAQVVIKRWDRKGHLIYQGESDKAGMEISL